MGLYIKKALKKFDERIVLDVSEIKLEYGKIIGVMGGNGSGKSTLVGGISGVTPLCVREIYLDLNEDFKAAIMLQDFYIFNTTIFKNLMVSGKFAGMSEHESLEKLKMYEDCFKIKDFYKKRGSELSGGEKAKVAFLRTILTNQQILIFDEPTANMDEVGSIEALKILKNQRDMGKIVILVTHDYIGAKKLCDDIIYLEKGKRIII